MTNPIEMVVETNGLTITRYALNSDGVMVMAEGYEPVDLEKWCAHYDPADHWNIKWSFDRNEQSGD